MTDRPPTTALPDSGARRRGVFAHREFRLLWAGESVSALGTSVSRLALPLAAVVTVHASAFAVAALTALAWLPWLIIGLPAGAWVDRLPRRTVMLSADALSLVAIASVPAAAWWGALTLAHLLVVAALIGLAAVFFETAYQVYLPGIIDVQLLPQANAAVQGSAGAAQVAGPGLAGAIAAAFGAVGGLAADAISFAVSITCLSAIRSPERGPEDSDNPERGSLLTQIRTGLSFLAHDPYLRVLTVAGAAGNFALMGYQALLVVFLVREVGISEATVGLLLSGMALGGLLGALVALGLGRRLGAARAMLTANLAAGPFALLIPLTAPGPRLFLTVIGGLGLGAGVVAGNVLKNSFRQAYVPRHLLGRVVVGMQFLNYGTIPLGALAAGALATAIGVRPTLWAMVAGVAVAPLLLLIGPIKTQRDFPATVAAATTSNGHTPAADQ